MASSPRLPALDVLRGIAILGTLATNIWIFSHPEGLVGYIDSGPTHGGSWTLTGQFLQQLSQGKFLGLLAIMFGIGMALQRRTALRAGLPWPGRYPLRAALLFVDGLLHYLLVAEFDVLMGYALTSWIVSWLLCASVRSQWLWIGLAMALHVAMLGAVVLAVALAEMPSGAHPVARMAFNAYADGSWWDLVLLRIDMFALFRAETVFIAALSVALFLLGARLLDAGVFEARGRRLRAGLMWLGLGVALPIDLLLGVMGGEGGFIATRYGTAPLVSLGLLALVAECYLRRPAPGFLGRRMTEVGRTALSCYVLQNLLASVICYGWGLGLAARIEESQRVPATVALYLLVSAAIMLFAHLWLRRFSRGPLEGLWNAGYRRPGSAVASA